MCWTSVKAYPLALPNVDAKPSNYPGRKGANGQIKHPNVGRAQL